MTVDDSGREIEQIIDILRSKNPKVTVLLGGPFHEWKPFPDLRAAYDALAKAKSTAASPVVAVDLSKGWVSKPDASGTHTIDWVHPNGDGDTRLAGLFLDALLPQLKRLGALK